MGFDKFGKVAFVAETKAADFVTHLEQGKVTVPKCKWCGTIYSPPKMDCPICNASDMDWLEVKGKGKLLTYTTVYFAPTGFEDDLPYTLALAEFEGGIRIFGRLSKEIPPDNIEIGLELKVRPVVLASDRISYEFDKA